MENLLAVKEIELVRPRCLRWSYQLSSNRDLPPFHSSLGLYPSHITAFFTQLLPIMLSVPGLAESSSCHIRHSGKHFEHIQDGLASSHFFFLRRHVIHPVFDLFFPFPTLLRLEVGVVGFFRGRPRFFTALVGVIDAALISSSVLSAFLEYWTGLKDVSSLISIFGTTASSSSSNAPSSTSDEK